MADKVYKLVFFKDDGTTSEVQFTAPQGEKGETGAKGADGHDYILTDDDKAEIVATVKAEVPLVKSAEEPTIVDSVDKMTDTSKFYVLSTDGYFYNYKELENYNLFKMSEVSYSSRLQDDAEGIISSTAQNAVTGWMPVEYGKLYSFSVLYPGTNNAYIGQRVTSPYPTTEPGETYIRRINGLKKDGTVVYGSIYTVHTVINGSAIQINNADVVAIRLQIYITSNDISSADKLGAFEPMFVEGDTSQQAYDKSVNSKYADGDAEVITEWYNTGLAYNQPADYEGRVIELETDVTELKESVAELEENMQDSTPVSPYYRNVNFGVLPSDYYKGLDDTYSDEGFTRYDTTYATFIETWKSLVANHSSYVTETELGTASDGQPIYLYDLKPVRISNQDKDIPKIIIIAGQHGGEMPNVYGLYYFVKNLLNKWNKHSALEYLRNNAELMIVPVLNTYGWDNQSYKNANGVNLNRNYNSNWVLVEDTASLQYGGAKPFDQPETQIVRDLLLNNLDAVLVVDSHTNGGGVVSSYSDINYYGISTSTDDYFNRMVDAVAHNLSAISANFNLDYELGQPDTTLGFLNHSDGTGILRDWVRDQNIVSALVEGFGGFPDCAAFTAEVYKANEEIIANWLITAMNFLNFGRIDDGNIAEKELSNLKNDVLELKDKITIPNYITAESERVANAILSTRTAKSLVFPVLSDMHLWSGSASERDAKSLLSAQYAGMGISELKKLIHLDFTAYLGDYSWMSSSGNYTAEQVMADITVFKKTTNTADKEIWCVGNHDLNYGETRDRLLTLDELYSYIGANSDGMKPYANIERGYGYLDFDNQKIRVIYLNTCDASDWIVTEGETAVSEWISPTQIQWLADTALDFSDKKTPSEWGIVIVGHHPLHYPKGCYGYVMTILESYRDGLSGSLSCSIREETDGTYSQQQVTYDFTTTERAEIICNIHGHNHNCGMSQISSTSWKEHTEGVTPITPWLWRFCIPNICSGRENSGYENFAYNDVLKENLGELDENGNPVYWYKETGTAKATSFCVVNIDRKNKKIYAYIFGAGTDRVIDYSEEIYLTYTNQIPISTDASGAVYNSNGYKENTYFSGESESTRSGVAATGFIPIGCGSANTARGEQVIYLQDIDALPTDTNVRVNFYSSDKLFIAQQIITNTKAEENDDGGASSIYTLGSDGYINKLDVTGITSYYKNSTGEEPSFFRICSPGIDGDSIITVNEPIG